MKFTNKVAIVTGAAGAGIGQGIARGLAKEGANVVVSDAHAKRPFSLAEDIARSMGVRTLGIQCDVSNLDQVNNMVTKTMDTFGRIDILINNAGVGFPGTKVVDMSDETWDRTIDICLKGTFYCCRAVLPIMISQKNGNIVNISSTAAWEVGKAGVADAPYVSAKAGVTAFTRMLAGEVGEYNIRVNGIAPAAIWNEFVERQFGKKYWENVSKLCLVGRYGTPDDIAKGVVFLVSDDASYITGEIMTIAGGRSMHP
jgi:3-oxoacyl-[acyl-carrier protein] reductase